LQRFEILSGEVEFEPGGKVVVARPGDVMTEPGTPHRFRNLGAEEIPFRTEVRPALQFETFLQTTFKSAADGKTDNKGMPAPV
jgi:quercetin dioxygenase-like cupin family protein